MTHTQVYQISGSITNENDITEGRKTIATSRKGGRKVQEDSTDDGNDNKISINPRGTKLPSNTVGFFIAQSAEEVKR